MGIFFGYWDCSVCGKNGIKGNIKTCPSCGKRLDDETEYYATKKREYLSDFEAKKINKNPDWLCDYCKQLNSDDNLTCVSCGAKRDATNLNYFQNRKKQEEKKIRNIERSVKTSGEDKVANFDSRKFVNDLTSIFINSKKILVTIALITLSILLVAGFIFAFLPKEQELTVKSFSWERQINIEKYKTVNESNWQLPSGARLKYTQEEFYKYQEVLDHYETKTKQVAKERLVGYKTVVVGTKNLGNGYFEEITNEVPIYETYYETEMYQEPVYKTISVYKTKYYYEIDKWVFERSVKTSAEDKNPYWGDFILKSDEREGLKSQTYKITGINDDGKEVNVILDFDEWNSLKEGVTYTFKINPFGNAELVDK